MVFVVFVAPGRSHGSSFRVFPQNEKRVTKNPDYGSWSFIDCAVPVWHRTNLVLGRLSRLKVGSLCIPAHHIHLGSLA